MTAKLTLAHCPELEPIGKRVPVEVWERIFDRLRPSQLSRLSMVNKNFNRIVSSLSVWSRMFSKVHPYTRLRTLRNIPESKSYMLYMCALSLHVCEKCYCRLAYGQSNLYRLPLPELAPMPRRLVPDDNYLLEEPDTYLGEEVDCKWTIQMCFSCRTGLLGSGMLEVPPCPSSLRTVMNVDYLQKKYKDAWSPKAIERARIQELSEFQILSHMRKVYGGDVGIEAATKSTFDADNKTMERILWYQQQD